MFLPPSYDSIPKDPPSYSQIFGPNLRGSRDGEVSGTRPAIEMTQLSPREIVVVESVENSASQNNQRVPEQESPNSGNQTVNISINASPGNPPQSLTTVQS